MSRQIESSGVQISSPKAGSQSLAALCADCFSLMKPRIIPLLLISTCCPMVLASGGHAPFRLVIWVLLGGALISGSASAMNCIWERDIDRLMERTKNRPMAADRLSLTFSVGYAFVVGLLGLLILAYGANPLAAAIALGGHLFYVFVYTIWLKRITPQNIVIGGAAGAVPPMVGWAAVTGEINLTAVLLFLLIFLWTPPHFWALALNKNSDYQRAGIPMLPVVAGERSTHIQMLCYALALIPVSVLLVISDPRLGAFSLTAMILLGVIFAWKILELKILAIDAPAQKEKKAWDVFGFSLIYLGLFFVCLVVDSVFV